VIVLAISIKENFLKGKNFPFERARGANALKENYTSYSEEYNLRQSIDIARSQLEMAVAAFNETTDDKAIDYASYNLLAARARYSYLIQLAKEQKLSL
jgi:hypothetical protein